MRHETKLIVIVTGKETKLLFADDQGCLSKPKTKTPKKLNFCEMPGKKNKYLKLNIYEKGFQWPQQ